MVQMVLSKPRLRGTEGFFIARIGWYRYKCAWGFRNLVNDVDSNNIIPRGYHNTVVNVL